MNSRIKDRSKIEELVKKKGYIKLRWHPDSLDLPLHKKTKKGHVEANAKWVLYGCPKNYQGPYEDYQEKIVAAIYNKNYFKRNPIGFRWVICNGNCVGNWIKEKN